MVEMRFSKTKIIGIILAMLLLSCIALSQEEDAASSGGWILSKLKQVPEVFMLYLVEILKAVTNAVVESLKHMILWNPNPDSIKPIVDDFIEILIPVYAMVITLLGVYIIFVSISPSGRAKAKSMFWKTLLSMVLVSVSLEIFKILLTISDALANRMLAGVVATRLPQFMLAMTTSDPFSFVFLYLNLAFFLISALIVVALRYILVLTLCAMFPFTLFLYFFDFTKDIGSKLLRYTMIAIYTQVVQALMLAITVISMNSLSTGSTGSENLVYAFLFIAGSLMIVLAPLIMMGIMKWIGGAVAGVGMVVSFINPALGGLMVTAGGVAAGMGPGALIAGGTAAGLGWAYRRGGT